MTLPRNQTKRRRRPRRTSRNPNQTSRQLSESASQPHSQDSRLRFKELVSESIALERQLSSLHNQLKQTHKESQDLDMKQANSAAFASVLEQIKAIEEEQTFVRESLQAVYGDLLLLDLHASCNLHIEEKLWRNAIYPGIEDIRGRIRKIKSKDKATRLEQQLALKIRHAIRFYRKINSSIKQEYHIDTSTIGIHLFRNDQDAQGVESKTAKVLHYNYICMGDLERYNAGIASQELSSDKSMEKGALAKQMYLKAIDIYRFNGKPYSQLALVSVNGGSAIDIVWYYCMSIAMREPAAIAVENLKSFYARARFSSVPSDSSKSSSASDQRALGRKEVARAVEKFLTFQKEMMFGSAEIKEYPSLDQASSSSNDESWDTTMEKATKTIFKIVKDDAEQAVSLLKLLRSTLMRITIILLVTAWYSGRRKSTQQSQEETSSKNDTQRIVILHGCLLHIKINSAYQDFVSSQDQLDANVLRDAEKAIVTATSIWATFLNTNINMLVNCCAGGAALRRGQSHVRTGINEDAEKLMAALSKLLSVVMSLKPFTPVSDRPLPSTFPLAEDHTLLGLVPLEPFHKAVDFLKEAKNDATSISSNARTEARWYRIYDLCQKLVESGAFAFISFDTKEQKYTIYDKESRQQQQTRLMKALAEQRLIDQVSSLENSLGKMTTSSKKRPQQRPSRTRQGPLHVFKVLLDVTAFLDGLSCVRRWAGQGSDSATHLRGFICEVIVPLDTIDSLDEHKKGTSHANTQARESIRYLDQKLERSSGGSVPTAVSAKESFLRTQRVTERLASWDDAQFYWIGEPDQPTSLDRNDQSDENEDEEVLLSAGESDSDDNDDTFLSSRLRRRADSDDSDEGLDESDLDSDVSDEEEEVITTYADIPKQYRPIISCLLYYHSHQTLNETSSEPTLVLATNDQDLTWWVSHFGDPQTGKRLSTKRVDEWDRVVRTKAFI
ncbi:hypothetical protein NQZ79_g3733 [Umbelopsis isabellina]|nr:hypothetical protein NQZ79_g3733 [Umbelopsis isabellina]